jgi:CDP-diacylglycerol--glycerol-3-phosphate 3-phosphatidyltransferase
VSLPDLLATARIASVPVIMGFVIAGGRGVDNAFGIAAILFLLAAFTDFLDGYFARRWGITTILGAFLDTTADKLLVTGTLLALIAVDRASVWVTFIIMAREFVVMALRGITAIEGTTVSPSFAGKAKAVVQFTAVFLAMMRLSEPWGPLYLDEWVMWFAAIVTIASGWDYLVRFRQVVRAVDSHP